MKHTPGPWRVTGEAVHGNERAWMVGTVDPQGDVCLTQVQRLADARLMAAAPQMREILGVLQWCLQAQLKTDPESAVIKGMLMNLLEEIEELLKQIDGE